MQSVRFFRNRTNRLQGKDTRDLLFLVQDVGEKIQLFRQSTRDASKQPTLDAAQLKGSRLCPPTSRVQTPARLVDLRGRGGEKKLAAPQFSYFSSGRKGEYLAIKNILSTHCLL